MPDRPLLALDPSSTAVGFALFAPSGRLMVAGSVRASSDDLCRRLTSLTHKLDPIIKSLPPDCDFIMEINQGREAQWQAKKGGRSKITTATLCHGQGWILRFLWERGIVPELVPDSVWTRGKGKKETRVRKTGERYPEFAAVWAEDSGGDARDAVALGEFIIARRTTAALMARGKVLAVKVPARTKKARAS